MDVFYNEDPKLQPNYDDWVKMPAWRHAPDFLLEEEVIFLLMNFDPMGAINKYEHLLKQDRSSYTPEESNFRMRMRNYPVLLSYENLSDLLWRALDMNMIEHKLSPSKWTSRRPILSYRPTESYCLGTASRLAYPNGKKRV